MARPVNPNKIKTTTISCKFEDSLLKRMDYFCEMNGMTRTDLLKEACELRISSQMCPDCGTLNVANARQCSQCGRTFSAVDSLRRNYSAEYAFLVSEVDAVERDIGFCYLMFEKIGMVDSPEYRKLKETIQDFNESYTKRFALGWDAARGLPVMQKDSVRGRLSLLEVPIRYQGGFVDSDEEGNIVVLSDSEQEKILEKFSSDLTALSQDVNADAKVVKHILLQLEEYDNGMRETFEPVRKTIERKEMIRKQFEEKKQEKMRTE